MIRLTAAALAAALIAAPVSAQDAPPTPIETAQILIDATNQALRDRDFETARRALEAALALKPGHGAYLAGLVLVGQRANRPDWALDALERIGAAGLGYDPARLGDGADALRAADPARFDAAFARIADNSAPVGSATRVLRIDAPDALIEAVAADLETERVFAGAVAARTIWVSDRFDRDNPTVFAGADDGLGSVFGLAVDDRHRVLWVASATVEQTPYAEGEEPGTAIFAFGLDGGDFFGRYGIDGAAHIGAVIVRDGVVYASDSGAPRLYRLRGLDGELEILSEDARFGSLQGIALAHGALYAADYSFGLWRVDLATGAASLVTPGAESLLGIDGLAATRDGRLFAVRNAAEPHQVFEIVLDATGTQVTRTEVILRGHPDFMEPTSIDIAGGQAWLVANSQWPLFPADGAEPEAARRPTIILGFEIPAPGF